MCFPVRVPGRQPTFYSAIPAGGAVRVRKRKCYSPPVTSQSHKNDSETNISRRDKLHNTALKHRQRLQMTAQDNHEGD